jgi:hypothetical protein
MNLRNHGSPLLRGLAAGVLVVAGTSACSRSDRTTSGASGQTRTDTVLSADTQSVASRPATTAQPSSADSSAATESRSSTSTTTASQTKPTAKTKRPASSVTDTGVSGYHAMGQDSSSVATTTESTVTDSAHMGNGQSAADTAQPSRDTVAVGDSSNIGKTGDRLEPTQSSEQANADSLANQPESDRIRPPEDSSETVGVSTGVAGDTTTALAQADTAAQATADTAAIHAQVDTSAQTEADTTGQTEMAQQAPVDTAPADTATVASADSAIAPVDSAEVQAQQPTEAVENDAAAVGAATVESANMATGAEAVALMSREGRRCTVVDAEEDKNARWDLAFSPATMNPCGTGTMTLPRVQAEK